MINKLFLREFKSSRLMGLPLWRRILSVSLNVVLFAAFIVLEVFVYTNLSSKLDVYVNFNKNLLIILMFGVSIIGIVYQSKLIMDALFSNKNELIILGPKPIKRSQILIGKLLYVFIKGLIFNYLIGLPLLVCYGILKDLTAAWYFNSIFVMLFLSMFELAVSALIVIPIRFVLIWLKKYIILLIIGSIIISLLLALLYSQFLNLFISLIQNSDLDSLFTEENMQKLTHFASNIYPYRNLILMGEGTNVAGNLSAGLAIIIGTFAVSYTCLYFYYGYYTKHNQEIFKDKKKLRKCKTTSPILALIKKELMLTFDNSDGVFSYFSLIVIQPFLIYLVISAINIIFNTGDLNYIKTLFPQFCLMIDTLLVLVFISIINSTSSVSLNKEKDMVLRLKVIPISAKVQFTIKMAVPFFISSLSYLATSIILVATDEIEPVSGIMLFFIGELVLISLNISSVISDLKSANENSIVSIMIDFLLPVVFALVSGVLLFLTDMSTVLYFGIILLLEFILSTTLIIIFYLKIDKMLIKFKLRSGLWEKRRLQFCYWFLL